MLIRDDDEMNSMKFAQRWLVSYQVKRTQQMTHKSSHDL